MPESPEPPLSSDPSVPLRTRAQQLLPRRAYRLRILGMGLAALPFAAVMHELHASWVGWAWLVLSCLVWPHLAFVSARFSRDPFAAELRNFVIDSAVAASWIPLLHFNLLPSAVLLTVVSADKINTGIRNLWLYSLPGMIVAMLGVGLLTGFAFQPVTSMFVLAACLPIMIIHTLAVSATSYRLVRRVQMQNLKLEELSRIDTMTGLLGRHHWENQAGLLLQHADASPGPTLMILDIDRFKDINDRFGHAVGDDVLRALADIVRRCLPENSHAGRWGGDEFVVAMPLASADAEEVAEQIRAAFAGLHFAHAHALQCTISIGLAQPSSTDRDLRSWLELADRALYRAKHGGRNRAIMA